MKTHRRYAVSTLSIAISALLVAASVSAQEATPAAPESTTTEAEIDARTLDAVVVTVERREQNLQKYAGTAQSFSQEELRMLGINTELRNLQVAVPGLSMSNQEGNLEIFIRGVGSANNTELGDPGAAPHVNGNYIPRPRGLGTMFYDVERVEINKGPQGTLRGRNALAGTLNIVTKRPELGGEFSGYVEGEIGSRNTEGFQVGLNMPLGEYAALRFAGYSLEKDSSFTNAGLGPNTPAGIQDEQAGRLSFLYEPDDRLSVFAMLDFGREGGTGYPGANIFSAACDSNPSCPTGPGFLPEELDLRQVVYTGPQGKLDSTGWGFQTTVSYDFGSVALEYNGSFRDVDFNQTNASSSGVLWPGRDLSPQAPDGTGPGVNYDNFSSVYWQTLSRSQVHELRLISDDDARFRWTAGAFYFHEEQQVGFFSLADRGIFYSGTEFTMPDVDGKSAAVFADGTFDVSDSFRVKGGIRYTEESKSRYGIGGNWTIGLGSAGFGCCFNVRLGTEGFTPALTGRPNFDVSGLSGNADFARFLLEGILTPGLRDTLIGNLTGVVDGTRPNGTCIDRPDNGGNTLDCPPNGQHSFFVLGIPSQQFGESKFDFFDWRLGMEYDLGEDSLLYATVSTGHKAGGFNDSFDPQEIPESFEPESLIALEIGSKNSFDFMGNRSTFNVSGFYYDYSDQVFQDLAVISVNPLTGEATGFALVNRNVGKSVLYGLEADSRLNLGNGFGLNLNALYLETEIKEGTVADVRSQNFGAGGATSVLDLSGNELPLSSKYTVNAQLTHAFDTGLGSFDWQVLASYRSDFYLTQFNERDVTFIATDPVTGGIVTDRVETAAAAGFPDQQDGYTQVNAGAGWTSLSGAFRVELYGSNLTNKDISQKALVGSGINVRFLNDARAYGLRVRYIF